MTDASPALDGDAPDVTSAPSASDTSPATPEPAEARTERDWETEVKSLRAEAKKYRLSARSAEAERDTLRGRVDAADRREVERIAGESMQNASDLWLTTNISDLRDEEGEIDRERVSERVEQLLSERSHWRKTSSVPTNFSSGVRQPIRRNASLGEAFKRSIGGR